MFDRLRRLLSRPSGPSAAIRHGTVSVTNMTGYVGVAERMPPEQLVPYMNRWYAAHGDAIAATGGAIDKLLGDAIIAYWLDGGDSTASAAAACDAALRQLAAMEAFHAWAREQGHPCPAVRIGIATGQMVAGWIGSPIKPSFTVMGDVVNLAARLDPACKIYGTSVLIPDATQRALPERFATRQVEVVRTPGKAVPIVVYELAGLARDLSATQGSFLAAYNRALLAFNRRDWEGARQLFKTAQEICPEDRPTAMHLERCALFKTSPPAEDWDGVAVVPVR